MAESYERYYDSNIYDGRYPIPNRLTLGRVERFASRGSTLIDIGAGNGRYAIALAIRGYRVIATERSSVARRQLAERVDSLALCDAISIFADITDVPEALLAESSHVLTLFGLLGHMSFEERLELFRFISSEMVPETRIAGSVPNRLRRFKAEQRMNAIRDEGLAPRFWYTRAFDGTTSYFEYTAFSPTQLRNELVEYGWKCDRITPESLLPEEIVTGHQTVGAIDVVLSRRLPPVMGYGMYFEASR